MPFDPAAMEELEQAFQKAEQDLSRLTKGTKEYNRQLGEVERLLKKVNDADRDRTDDLRKEKEQQDADRREQRRAVMAAPSQLADQARGAVGGGIGAMAALAGGPIVGVLSELAGKMSSFVEALNPSAVMMFSRAMKDLQAVVGTALAPVFEVLTEAVREAGDLLLPVTQELAPVFGQIARTAMSVLQPMMQVVANNLRSVVPVLQVFADVMAGLAPLSQTVWTTMAAVTKTLGDFVASLFGSGYRTAMDNFRATMQRLAAAVLTAVGAIGVMSQRMFGFGGGFVDNLIQSLRGGERGAAGGLAAAQGGQVTSMAAWEQQQLSQAFMAMGRGEGVRSDNEWLQEVARNLQQMRDNNGRAEDWLRQNFGAALNVLRAIEMAINALRNLPGAAREAADRALTEVEESRQRNPNTWRAADAVFWWLPLIRRRREG